MFTPDTKRETAELDNGISFLESLARLSCITGIMTHHRDTEGTEKDFFHLPGDTGK
jgi:hypothetical protein